MKSTDINRYPIREYLAGLNIYPAKDKGYYGMYHSLFREDSNASMKVDYDKNLWIDYGSNDGGTLIDLVMRIENCSNGEAMRKLEQHLSGTTSFSFQGNNLLPTEREPAIAIQSVKFIENPALIAYLKKRNIDIDIAKQCCREVHYSVGEKPYFAIGFPNDAGGYELRSKYFKGCTSKDITSLKAGQDSCLLFEGFMDYLSFLTMKNRLHSPVDTIVLNSLTNLPKITNTLTGYKSVALFLDNDEAGKRAVQHLRPVCKEVIDQSVHYANHKDLNDYLYNRSVPKQAIKKKPGRGLKI